MTTLFSLFQSSGGTVCCKWIIKFLRSLNEGHLRFLQDFINYIKKLMRAYTTSILNDNSIRAIFSGAKFNNTSRNDWKPLLEEKFSKNSTKTIRLIARYFYEVIVAEAVGRIDYHLIEIESD